MALLNIFNMIDPASLSIFLVSTLIIYFIKYILVQCQREPRLVKFAKTMSGPTTLPLVGNSLDFCSKKDTLSLAVEYNKKYGDVYRLWLGNHLAAVFSNIDDLEIIFMNSKMLSKPRLFQPFKDFFGDGLFTTHSISKWRRNRKVFQPVFGRSALHKYEYTTVINEKTDFVVKKLQNLVDGPEFDIWYYMSNLGFDIILKSAMNVDLDWDDELLLKYYGATLNGLEISFKKLTLPWLQHKAIDYLFYQKKSQKYRKQAEEVLRKLVEKKKREILHEIEIHKNNSAVNSEDIPPKRFLTLAYELAELENNENAMLDELVVVLAGGTDPALITALFLLMVAIHQDVQNKLYDELFEVFGDSDRPAAERDVERLPYLDQVIRETLRRFPMPLMFREAEEDIKIGDRIIPKGTVTVVSIAAVHFNPTYYPDPWKFNPDNFSPQAVEKRPKLAFLAFSAGPRMCIGYNFAMLEMKLTLSAFLRNFSFYTTMKMEEIHMDSGIVMTSVNGYRLTIKSRIRKPTYLKK